MITQLEQQDAFQAFKEDVDVWRDYEGRVSVMFKAFQEHHFVLGHAVAADMEHFPDKNRLILESLQLLLP